MTLMKMLRNHRAHPRRGRGYSLLELVIVALLAAALVALIGRWVGQLGQVALQQATGNLNSASVVTVDRIEDDIVSAVSCTGTDSPIREISASRLELYVSNGSGVQLVRWEVDATTGNLTRAAVEPTQGCEFPEPPAGAFVLGSVVTGTAGAPLFTPLSEATVAGSAEVYGTCSNRDLDRCRIDAVETNLTVLDGATPVVSRHVVAVGA